MFIFCIITVALSTFLIVFMHVQGEEKKVIHFAELAMGSLNVFICLGVFMFGLYLVRTLNKMYGRTGTGSEIEKAKQRRKLINKLIYTTSLVSLCYAVRSS